MDVGDLSGFRRRFLIVPSARHVTAAVEDDYHCMAVTLHHDGSIIVRVEAVMDRVPWTTCPGAAAVLSETFVGVALDAVVARGAKQANCTHLHDLALLAAAHVRDEEGSRYDILVSDPLDGIIAAEIRRNDMPVHRLVHRDDVVIEPLELAGTSLFRLRGWIEGLTGIAQEAARLLQWGAILAHGRVIPMERQSDASIMPANCFTFQPERKGVARRVGKVLDFSKGQVDPLDHFDGAAFAERP